MRVKGNQPTLREALVDWFEGDPRVTARETTSYQATAAGHGRVDSYRIEASAALNEYLTRDLDWPGVGQALRIERRSVALKRGTVETSVHYGITSLTPERAAPAKLLKLWRQHWGIENKGYWVLDTVFGEDASRARKHTLPMALALLRAGVVTLLHLLTEMPITSARTSFSAQPHQAASLIGVPLE
jgi:hypothetical protein